MSALDNTYKEPDNVAALQIKKRSDRLINLYLVAFFLTGLTLAIFYNAWVIALAIGGLCIAGFYTAKRQIKSMQRYSAEILETQSALADSIKRFEYVTKATSDVIWDRSCSESIINWGEGYHTLFGYQINDETKAVSFWRSRVHPEDVESVCAIIQNAKDDPAIASWTSEYRFLKANGEYAFVKEKAVILRDETGKAARTIGALQDVTESKQTELILKELNESLEKERSHERERQEALMDKAVAQGKFEIASDVIHDIGNAIVGFGSYLTRIRRLQAEDNPDTIRNLSVFFEKQRAAIEGAIGEAKTNALIKMLASMAEKQKANQEEINQSIIEQQNIINNIEEILNIQRKYIAGHESQERKPVHVHDIVNDSLSMLRTSIDKMGIQVRLSMNEGIPTIKGDRTKLMQAVLNVLRNSMEAMESITGEKCIEVNAFVNEDKLVLQLKDCGTGFGNVQAEQLFSKGFTTKPRAGGLGLYTCRKIIESHGGTIDIASAGTGKGALTTMEFKTR
ncbi:MAG TPA: PAS domain-containing sensor histidine kinase [Chitinophagaceae bacterium]|nr:PAS domain-containing sensor histidine kinase [Chitinophagaceae bacterium]